jgi:predicted SAM-dependent methyltransferase
MRLTDAPTPARLHLGCGACYLDGWVNADGEEPPVVEGKVGHPDLVLDMYDLSSLPNERFEWVYASHVIEHLFPSRLPAVLKNLHRILVPGGKLTLATVDLMGVIDHRYLEHEDGFFWEAALFGACDEHDHPMAAHRNCFDAAKLTTLLAHAGFTRMRPWRTEDYAEIHELNDYARSARLVSLLLEGIK